MSSAKVMSSTAPTQPVVVRPRVSRKPLPPRADLTQAFQTMMPYVAVVLISLIAYSAYHKSDTTGSQLSIFSLPSWGTQSQLKSDIKEASSESIKHLEELKQDLKQAAGERLDAAKEKLADFRWVGMGGSQKWEEVKEAAEEKLDVAKEKLSDIQEAAGEKLEQIKEAAEEKLDSAAEKLPELWQQWKSWGEGKIDELKEAMSLDQSAPTEVAPFTQKVSDFLLRIHSGEIDDSTIIKYFGVSEDWRSLSAGERTDQLLHQMHRFGPKAVEFLIDGITLDYSSTASQ